MQTASAKAKGRNLQKWVRDKILTKFRTLNEDDCRSTGMGQSGEDVQLSQYAKTIFPYSIECKVRKTIAVYKMYKQAQDNSNGLEPLLIIRADRKKALAVIDADYFFSILPNSESTELYDICTHPSDTDSQ